MSECVVPKWRGERGEVVYSWKELNNSIERIMAFKKDCSDESNYHEY